MRKLTEHKVPGLNALNDSLEIAVMDGPGAGGASHRYEITGFSTEKNASVVPGESSDKVVILFQNGPIQEVGSVNGISQEALLAIVIDRLRSFHQGPYASKENACALTHLEEGLMWLQKRTQDRVRRGVEGTSAK